MKTEKEIRAYRANMIKAPGRPCSCAATGHAMECLIGGHQMRANIMVLDWLLGDAPAHERYVEELAAQMRQ
jgi:hypothetical protein